MEVEELREINDIYYEKLNKSSLVNLIKEWLDIIKDYSTGDKTIMEKSGLILSFFDYIDSLKGSKLDLFYKRLTRQLYKRIYHGDRLEIDPYEEMAIEEFKRKLKVFCDLMGDIDGYEAFAIVCEYIIFKIGEEFCL